MFSTIELVLAIVKGGHQCTDGTTLYFVSGQIQDALNPLQSKLHQKSQQKKTLHKCLEEVEKDKDRRRMQ